MTSTYPSSPSSRVIIGYSAPSTTAAQQIQPQPQQQQQKQQQQQQSSIPQQQEHPIGTITNTPSSRKSSDANVYRTDGSYIYDNQTFDISSSVNDATLKNQLYTHNNLKLESRRDVSLYANGNNDQIVRKNEVRIFMYPPSNNIEPPIVATTLSNAVNDLKLLVNCSTPSSSTSTSTLPATTLNGCSSYDGMTHILVQNRAVDNSHQLNYSMHQLPNVMANRRSTLSYVLDTNDNANNDNEHLISQRQDVPFVPAQENNSESHQVHNVDSKKRRIENESENERARRRARDAETKRARRQRESSEQRMRRLLRDSQRMRRTRRIKRLLGPTATLSDLKKTGLTLEDLDSFSTGRRRGVRNSQAMYASQQNRDQSVSHSDSHQDIQHLQPSSQSMQIVAAAPPQNNSNSILYDPRLQQQISSTQQQNQIINQQHPQQQQSMLVPLVAASSTTVVQQQPQLLQTQNGNYVTVHWTLPPGADPNQPPVLHLPGAPQHIIVQRSPPVTLTTLPEDGKPHIIHVAPPPAQPHHAHDGTIISSQGQMIGQRHIINRSSASTQPQQQKPLISSSQHLHHHMQSFHSQNPSINSSYQQQPLLQQQPQHSGQQLLDPQYHQTIVYRTAAPPLPRHQQPQNPQQAEEYDMDEYKEFIVHRPVPQQSNSATSYQTQTQMQQMNQQQRPINSQQLLQNVHPSTSSYQVHQITSKGRRRGGVVSEKDSMPSVYTAVPPPPRETSRGPSTVYVSTTSTLSGHAFPKRRSAKTNKKPKHFVPPPPLSERFRGLTEEQIRRRRRANAERSRRRRQLETPEQRRERNRRTAERMRARRARIANERFLVNGKNVETENADVQTSSNTNPSLSIYSKPRQVVPLSTERFEEIFQRVLERCRNPTADDTMLSAIALPQIGHELKDEMQHDDYTNGLDVTSSQNTSMEMVESILQTQTCATPSYISGTEEGADENMKQLISLSDTSSNKIQISADNDQKETSINALSSSLYNDSQNERLAYDAVETDNNVMPCTNELSEEYRNEAEIHHNVQTSVDLANGSNSNESANKYQLEKNIENEAVLNTQTRTEKTTTEQVEMQDRNEQSEVHALSETFHEEEKIIDIDDSNSTFKQQQAENKMDINNFNSNNIHEKLDDRENLFVSEPELSNGLSLKTPMLCDMEPNFTNCTDTAVEDEVLASNKIDKTSTKHEEPISGHETSQ